LLFYPASSFLKRMKRLSWRINNTTRFFPLLTGFHVSSPSTSAWIMLCNHI